MNIYKWNTLNVNKNNGLMPNCFVTMGTYPIAVFK